MVMALSSRLGGSPRTGGRKPRCNGRTPALRSPQTMSEDASDARRWLFCRHCNDLIGVYEPMVLMTPELNYETSLASDPSLYQTEHRCYHRTCFDQAAGGGDRG